MSIARRDFLKIAAAGGAASGLFAGKAPAQGGRFPKKVVILGFDGASPYYVEQWMDAGLLPNLARLREKGTYAPIMTANPPQTPVSWASFATGKNPGKTGLFDFLRRDPKTYMPDLSLVKEGSQDFLAGGKNPLYFAAGAFAAGGVAGLVVKALYNVIKRRENPLALKEMFDPRLIAAVAGIGAAAGAGAFAFAKDYLPDQMPTIENGTRGEAFWQFLDGKGIPTCTYRIPARFPADRLEHGRAVAGLGVPDVHKTMGLFTYYTTEMLAPQQAGDTEMGGKIVPLYFKPTTQETKTVVFGPVNELFLTEAAEKLKKAGQYFGDKLESTSVELRLKIEGDYLSIETPDWSGRLKAGQWSEPVTFSFKFNSLLSLEGYGKFYLLELNPNLNEVKLYLQPLSFHPKTNVVRMGPVRISTPQSLIGDLYDRFGKFKTLGWAADTWALNELRIPEEVFLEDLREYVQQYRQIMMYLMEADEPLFVDVYSFTDRIAHMFWHHLDKGHPLYDETNAGKYAKVVLEAYQLMDSIVGEAMAKLDDSAYFFVLSDHGFHSFRHSFNCNTWLAQNGFIVSKSGAATGRMMKLDDLFGKGQFWENVDWSKSTAYALGLGGIYINVKGREDKGVVGPADYENVRQAIIDGLEAYVDPNTGEKPVFRVYRREESYTGYDPNEMPDLRVSNNPHYRAGWQSSLGGFAANAIEPNARKWSGDHCSFEPSLTRGIFFCNKQLPGKNPNLMDFFPTVAKIFGFDAPGDVDGKSLV